MANEKDTKPTEPKSPPRTTNPNTTNEVRGTLSDAKPDGSRANTGREQRGGKPRE